MPPLRAPTFTGSTSMTYYWIGYRPANTDNAHLTRGAYLLWEKYLSDNPNEKSMLLDTTPLTSGSSAAGKADSGLDIGRTYSDATAGIHITPVGYGGSSDGKYLDVQVHTGTLSSGSCTALVGGSSSIYARTDTAFTATASSSTGATLAYFWDAGDGTITGGSGANAAVFSHSYTTSGTYTVSLTVSDMKGATASGSLVVNVTDPAQQFTQRNNGTSGDINAVAASDTLIVAVGAAATSAGSRIRTSPDGETWTERPVPDTTTNLRLESVVWDGTRFVAVGQDYSSTLGWFGVIYTSTNGITWSRTYNSSTGDSALNAVSAGNGTILAVGDSGTVLQSSDGSNWAPITGIPSVTSGSMSCRGIAFGGGIFVLTARAQANTTGSGAVFTSTDNGASWREQTTGAGLLRTEPALHPTHDLEQRRAAASRCGLALKARYPPQKKQNRQGHPKFQNPTVSLTYCY
ncbi:MAG: PKD domain-containing protein [Verrucomicrobia bacterium]|nr:PKD domain-containing protein [Verrucomicrobiota bacterium]